MRPPAQGVGKTPATKTRRGTPREKALTFRKTHLGAPDGSAHNSLPADSTGHQSSSLRFQPRARGTASDLLPRRGDLGQSLLVANSPLFPGTLLSSLSSTQAPCRPPLPQPAQALAALRSGHVPSGAVVRAVSHRGVSSLLTAAHVTSLLRAGTLADGHRRPVSQKR